MQSATSMVQGPSSDAALVVDNDQDYVQAIGAALSEDLSQIDSVNSVASAVSRLQGQGYRAVILDCTLPGDPTPIDLVRALRRTRPEVAIIMTSASRLTAIQVAACFGAGADEYIAKPFHPQEFGARVRAVTRRVRRSMASMSQSAPTESLAAETLSVEQELRATA